MFSTTIEVLIKFLEAIPQIRSVATNVIKITIPKNGGHFKRRAAIGRRNNRITTTSRRSKQVPACVSNIDYAVTMPPKKFVGTIRRFAKPPTVIVLCAI